MLVSASFGAILVTALPSKMMLPLVMLLLLVSVAAGWMCAIQGQAFRYVSGIRGALIGHLIPVPSKWVSRLEPSSATSILLMSVTALLGVSIRMLWLAYA